MKENGNENLGSAENPLRFHRNKFIMIPFDIHVRH